MKNDKKSLLKGAFILGIGAFISKLLGAIYRIPLTNLLGSFVVEYGKLDYVVGSPTMSQSNRRSLFSTTIFGSGNSRETTNEEYVNITKRDYEMLISRVNQLTEQMNKLKKKK